MATGGRPPRDNNRPSSAAIEKLLEGVPPYDENAEASVLGSMLMDHRAADIALETLKVDDFYLPRHKTLFTLFSELFQKTEQVDEVYVCGELERRGLLEEIGGKDYPGQLILKTPTAANIESYCDLVRSRAIERELLIASARILNSIKNPSGQSTQDLIDEAEKSVFEIADKRTGKDAVSMQQLMSDVIAKAEKVQVSLKEGREPECPAIPTTFEDLDKLLCGGFWPGELIIIAGRPSMGKTTFALNIARRVAVGNEKKVKATAIFSLEMSSEQVSKNLLCAHVSATNPGLDITGQKLRRLILDANEFEALSYGSKQLGQAPLFIDDTSAMTVPQLRARCRRLKLRKDLKMVIIDYLQLMKGTSYGATNREQEVSEISRSLKGLARDLECPVIVLSQLNRSAEKRDDGDKRPQLSDLRESGAIEQDADVVIMLYRPEYYDLEANARHQNIGEALVLKNRNGPVGTVKLTFFKDVLRFEPYMPEHNVAAGE
ncbi:MAG TPA: replicative DNA helicase [Planctomycetota bacterium]|jgi:replicative DNA helicase